jgi:hypothetical protein
MSSGDNTTINKLSQEHKMKTHSPAQDQDSKPRATARQIEQASGSLDSAAKGVTGQCKQQNMIDTSPYVTAQRKRLAGISEPVIQNQGLEEEELLQGKLSAQRQIEEEEELIQGKFAAQRKIKEEEEELMQGKFAVQRQPEEDEELMQGKFAAQRLVPEEEELMQGKFIVQRQTSLEEEEEPIQGKKNTQHKARPSKDNNTGLPDAVKSKMETNLEADFSAVRVHPNSAKATEVDALAYTQGTDIHFAPGQFKPESSAGQQLLGHELTHVIQQSQGKVKPTREVAGMPVNDDPNLEKEADAMGKKM